MDANCVINIDFKSNGTEILWQLSATPLTGMLRNLPRKYIMYARTCYTLVCFKIKKGYSSKCSNLKIPLGKQNRIYSTITSNIVHVLFYSMHSNRFILRLTTESLENWTLDPYKMYKKCSCKSTRLASSSLK